jgi:glutamate-ammonia-ligase adenylyltransferase
VFFARLGQRIIHMLEIFTPAGVLYEVDMRLRPSGNSGLLVSSLEAFTDYQRTEAWTWEHQALIRSRVVAGDPKLAKTFSAIRESVLVTARDPDTLRAEVRGMRERMRAELDKTRGGGFHIKQGRGGIVDIEFMVQYLVLRWCPEHGALTGRTDTIGLLEVLSQQGLLPPREAETLITAYREYRALLHRMVLAEVPPVAEQNGLTKLRDGVVKIWQRLIEA